MEGKTDIETFRLLSLEVKDHKILYNVSINFFSTEKVFNQCFTSHTNIYQ